MELVRKAGRKLAVLVCGIALILAGIVMLITPGPGIITIIAGMLLLAREFSWARCVVDAVKRRIPFDEEDVKRWWSSRKSPQQQPPPPKPTSSPADRG